jgi:hypothetical protein
MRGLLCLLVSICACGNQTAAVDASAAEPPTLRLLREKKLSHLVSQPADHFEASGITRDGDRLVVVFDNMTALASVDLSLAKATTTPGSMASSSYEAIAPDPLAPRFYVLRESDGGTPARPQVVIVDRNGTTIATEPIVASFVNPNKAFEGIALVVLAGERRLLALCEGNFCADDVVSAGHGQVRVFAPSSGGWTLEATLDVPPEANFKDFSDLAIDDNGDGTYRIAIVSQASSALWMGTLATAPSAFVGAGARYQFPRDATGAIKYCTLEGVTFLGAGELAFVSDKSDGSLPCNATDESIHVFALP